MIIYMNDEELIIRVREGDNLAFEALVDKYRNSAVLFAYGYLSDFHVAEEVVQDAFVKLYLSIDKYDSKKASLKTYLFTIVKRLCIDNIRKKRVDVVPLEDNINLSNRNIPEEIVICKEEYEIILKNIEKLNDNYKKAIILRDYDNMSYEEIAHIMDKSLSSVKSYIHRGRKKLFNFFRKECGK